MLGLALATGVDASAVTRSALAVGLVVNAPNPRTIRLLPALTMSADEAATGIQRLLVALDENRPISP